MVHFGVKTISDNIVTFFGENEPQKPPNNRRFPAKVAKILKLAYYQNYCIHSNQMLHSDKDHQTTIVGGPITHTTNPRWRTAAILKNRKIAISWQQCR